MQLNCKNIINSESRRTNKQFGTMLVTNKQESKLAKC